MITETTFNRADGTPRLQPSPGDLLPGTRNDGTVENPAPINGGEVTFAEAPGTICTTQSSLKLSEESRINEANRRKALLETYRALLAAGFSKVSAAREVGSSVVTIWRWENAFEKKGFNGLLPDTDKCGRKSALAKLGLTKAELKAVIEECKGLNLDLESGTGAARLYAQSDRCPESLARIILDPNRSSKHALPPSLRRAIKTSKAEQLAHRGERQLALGGIWTPRKMDILPGDIFSADDTTPIWAWWVPWVECEEYPFGVKLLQGQFLPVIDVASQKVLTFALIAREKSSYRACDIWALFGHTFDAVGVPRLGWQLERGSWEAGMIAGQEVEYQEGELTLSRRVGGLRQLPTQITPWHQMQATLGGGAAPFPKTLQTWTSYLPKSKSIEALFNRSQSLEGTLWGCLGRDQMRRPYEKMKKLFQECSRVRSKTDPRQHFLSQAEISARLVDMLRYLNNEPMEGEVFSGVPDRTWQRAIADYPLYPMDAQDAWLYRRDWKVVQITRGWARVRLTHEISGERYSLFYGNAEEFARHDGEEVVVYYDKQNFEKPAHVLLARTGEYLCEAEYVDRKGSFLDGDQTGHDMRKRWKNAVMTAYAVIAQHAPSRQVPEEVKRRRQAAPTPNDFERQPEQAEPAPIIRQTVTRPAPAAPTSGRPAAEQLQRSRSLTARLAERARQLEGLTGS